MTASTTRCSPSGADAACLARRLIRVLLALLLPLLQASALAGDAELRDVALRLTDDGCQLHFDVLLELNPRLEEVVSRGVPLYFVAEFELTRPRWYWFDENLANKTRTFRLSYHALTRQYRLGTGALYQNFPTLEAALRTMTRVRSWNVVERGAIKSGATYEAQLRFRLDLAQMPKPFQITAIGNKDWVLGTEWLRWTYVPGAADNEPAN